MEEQTTIYEAIENESGNAGYPDDDTITPNVISNLPVTQNESSQILGIIERLAMSPGSDMAKLEKMIDLQERILNKNAQMAFAADFSAMQVDMPEILQTGEIKHNGKLISKYAKFEDINTAIRPIISKYGFGVSFRVNQDGGPIKVKGILSHKGGHEVDTDITLPADNSGSKNNVQAIASSISYAKRHIIKALLNIAERGEDDDGNKAGEKGVNDFQKEAMKDVLMQCNDKTRDWFANTYGCIDDVPAKMFTQVHERLKAARDLAKKEAEKGGTNAA